MGRHDAARALAPLRDGMVLGQAAAYFAEVRYSILFSLPTILKAFALPNAPTRPAPARRAANAAG